MFFIILLVLFPLLYLLFGKYALIVLVAAIVWKYIERTTPSSARKPTAKRGRDDEPEYQAGYEN